MGRICSLHVESYLWGNLQLPCCVCRLSCRCFNVLKLEKFTPSSLLRNALSVAVTRQNGQWRLRCPHILAHPLGRVDPLQGFWRCGESSKGRWPSTKRRLRPPPWDWLDANAAKSIWPSLGHGSSDGTCISEFISEALMPHTNQAESLPTWKISLHYHYLDRNHSLQLWKFPQPFKFWTHCWTVWVLGPSQLSELSEVHPPCVDCVPVELCRGAIPSSSKWSLAASTNDQKRPVRWAPSELGRLSSSTNATNRAMAPDAAVTCPTCCPTCCNIL